MGQLMIRAWMTVRANRRLIMVTFEIFWIVVFVLDRVGRGSDGGVPQFVYVNF